MEHSSEWLLMADTKTYIAIIPIITVSPTNINFKIF
jgi:hypothetical protein